MTPDGLTLYFARSTGGPSGPNDIYTVTRTDSAADFDIGAAKQVGELTSAGSNSGLTLSGDGLTAYFVSNRSDGGTAAADVFGATRANADGGFDSPARLPFTHSKEELCSYVVPDKSALYVSVYEGGRHRLYRAPLPGGPFAELDAPNIVNSSNVCSVVTPDDLTMLFASDSNGDPGAKGSWDVYLSRRGNRGDLWGAPTLQTQLNTTGPDIPSYLSADGCEVWLHSRRPGLATYDVLVARRPK